MWRALASFKPLVFPLLHSPFALSPSVFDIMINFAGFATSDIDGVGTRTAVSDDKTLQLCNATTISIRHGHGCCLVAIMLTGFVALLGSTIH